MPEEDPYAQNRLEQELTDRVRTAMTVRGWNQSDLARATHVTEKHVSQVLSGRARGTVAMWDRFLGAVLTLDERCN